MTILISATITEASEKIHVLAPFGIGQIIFDIGLGFDDPNYISPSREEWVCDFCEYYFLDSIITMRSSVVLEPVKKTRIKE